MVIMRRRNRRGKPRYSLGLLEQCWVSSHVIQIRFYWLNALHSPYTIEIYRIDLQDLPSQPTPGSSVRPINIITKLSNTRIVRGIYPAFKLIALCRDSVIDVVNWETKQTVALSMESEVLDPLVSELLLRF
jgi:hypothetical protein